MPVDDDTLRAELAAVVMAIEGVARLEPTLKNMLARFTDRLPRPGGRSQTGSSPIDGITITTHGQITDINIDISVTGQALATAATVQDEVRIALTARSRQPGTVTVNVLNIDQATATPMPTAPSGHE